MAEILLKQNGSGRAHIMPRIDLTPMVDLGFLLITFFMMTTTMGKPKRLDIQMPSTQHTEAPTAFYESSAITLMPAKNHVVYYYEGLFNPAIPLKEVSSMEALRQVLQNKEKALRQRAKPAERDIQVLIKSHATSTVNDIVALFDEMRISNISYYAMVDITPEESSLIDKHVR
jgi:biopolymer transport protein ExbD